MSMDSAQIERVLAPAAEIATPVMLHPDGGHLPETGNPMSAARGIANAVLISVPFWVLFAFALYLLI